MIATKNLNFRLAFVLRASGRSQCLAKADQLEFSWDYSGSLALRGMDLTPSELSEIITILSDISEQELTPLVALSLSYNPRLGDEGIEALIDFLPSHIRELGLVNCGFGNRAGEAMLNRALRLTDLKMICLEENHLSDELKGKFDQLRTRFPGAMVVV